MSSTRSLCVLVLTSVLAVTLSGCGPILLGTTGITVAEDGSPIIVLGVCSEHIASGGILDTGVDGKAYRSAGSWISAKPVGKGLTVLPVASPPPGWAQEKPAVPLVPKVRYVAAGATADNNGATDGVAFTVADLKGLTPGTVLYRDYVEVADDESTEVNRKVKLGDFLKTVCDKP